MAYDPNRALELLLIGSGRPDATFRDDQEAAIQHVVEGKGRLLVVQKTGWGKSRRKARTKNHGQQYPTSA